MNTKKLSQLGVLLAFAIILGYIEMLIPFSFAIPGIKLGLANLVMVILLYQYGKKEAFLLNIVRILICCILFSNFSVFLYSVAGASCSFLIMSLLYKNKDISVIGISILGGIFHNIGQICMAYFIVQTQGVFYYLPFLLLSGAITGYLIGLVVKYIMHYMNTLWKQERI